jgi:cell division protein FtsI/penicillin-binding protein 2
MQSRYYFLVLIFGAAAVLWSAYLFCIQILDPFNFAHLRRVRYIPRKEILVPRRGAIYDAKGNLLVSSVSYYQIDIDRGAVNTWADRNDIGRDEAFNRIAETIAKYSNVEKEAVLKRMNKGNKNSSIQISNKISEAELDNIIQAFSNNKLPGLIHNFASMRRIYSKGVLAARLMGSVKEESSGYDPVTNSKSLYKLSGMNGLEATFDKNLAGGYGWREIVLDANGNRVPYPDLHEKKPRHGQNVYLTIDSKVQEIVENALYEGVEKYGALHAGAVVMDPKTGRLIALAGVSNSDKTDDQNIVRSRSNIPASFMFEPGSTMKPITMLSALEYKLVKPNELIECGHYQVGRRKITDTHDYGPLNARGIIAKSSNVGVA